MVFFFIHFLELIRVFHPFGRRPPNILAQNRIHSVSLRCSASLNGIMGQHLHQNQTLRRETRLPQQDPCTRFLQRFVDHCGRRVSRRISPKINPGSGLRRHDEDAPGFDPFTFPLFSAVHPLLVCRVLEVSTGLARCLPEGVARVHRARFRPKCAEQPKARDGLHK